MQKKEKLLCHLVFFIERKYLIIYKLSPLSYIFIFEIFF